MSKEGAGKYADYSYAAMSNLVTKADRRTLPKQAEGTGEPESLSGRIEIRDMGTRSRAPKKSTLAAGEQRSEAVPRKVRKKEYVEGFNHGLTSGH